VMGDDFVTHCASVDGKPVEAHFSRNDGKSNKVLENSQMESNSLTLISSESADGHIYCKYQHLLNDAAIMPDGSMNLNEPLFLLWARGPVRDPKRVFIHSTEPSDPDFPRTTRESLKLLKPIETVESSSVDDNANEQKTETAATPTVVESGSGPLSLATSTKRTLVRLHGLVMIVAWIPLIGVAIFSARYLREMWPSTTPMGLKIWFIIHRTLNFCAVILILVGSVMVFVGKDLRWTGPATWNESETNWQAGSVHSLIGVIAVILAVFQPFGALARCSPDHPRRKVFNVFHHGIGFIGLALALIAIFIAVLKFKSLWADIVWALVVFILYALLSLAIIVAIEIVRAKLSRERHTTAIEMHNKTSPATDSYYYHTTRNASVKAQRLTKIIFGAFVVVSVIAAVILLMMVLG
jgi:hypothetical protein